MVLWRQEIKVTPRDLLRDLKKFSSNFRILAWFSVSPFQLVASTSSRTGQWQVLFKEEHRLLRPHLANSLRGYLCYEWNDSSEKIPLLFDRISFWRISFLTGILMTFCSWEYRHIEDGGRLVEHLEARSWFGEHFRLKHTRLRRFRRGI